MTSPAHSHIKHRSLGLAAIVFFVVSLLGTAVSAARLAWVYRRDQRSSARIVAWAANRWTDTNQSVGKLGVVLSDLLDAAASSGGARKVLRSVEDQRGVVESSGRWRLVQDGRREDEPVYFDAAIFLPPLEGSGVDEERRRLSLAMSKLIGSFRGTSDSADPHCPLSLGAGVGDGSLVVSLAQYSRCMARTLNIDGELTSTFPELRILWVYMGTSSGAFASFPANDQTYEKLENGLPKRYDPRDRPWFKAAMAPNDRALNEAFTMHGFSAGESGLSNLYPDYHAASPTVRTAWARRKIGDREFVVGVDFFVPEVELPVASPNGAYARMALTISGLVAGLLSGALTLAGARISGARVLQKDPPRPHSANMFFSDVRPNFDQERFVARLTGYAVYSPRPPMAAEANLDPVSPVGEAGAAPRPAINVTARLRLWVAELTAAFPLRSAPRTPAPHLTVRTTLSGPFSGERALSRWRVQQVVPIVGQCKGCRQMVEIRRSERDLGTISLSHRAADHIEVRGDLRELEGEGRAEGVTGLVRDLDVLKRRLRGAYLRSPWSWRHGGDPAAELEISVKRAELSDKARRFMALSGNGRLEAKWLRLTRGVMDVEDSGRFTAAVFAEADVRALCQPAYFRAFMSTDEGSRILGTGSSIERVIICATAAEAEKFGRGFANEFADRMPSSVPARLFLTSVEEVRGDLGSLTTWDFALVKSGHYGSFVCWSNALDHAHPRRRRGRGEATQQEVIRGTASWQRTDVEFYEELYSHVMALARDRVLWG